MHGFSLLELMLVLLVMGLAYGLAGPQLSERSLGLEINSATRQLAAGLRKARDTAITQRRDAALTIDIELRSFRVSGDPKVYELPKSLEFSLFTAQSELLHTQVGSIRFFQDGSSTGGRISAAAGEAKQSVDVDWITGRVTTL